MDDDPGVQPEPQVVKKPRVRRRSRQRKYQVFAASQPSAHVDSWNLDALQKTAEDMVKEDGPEKSMKRTVPVGEVTKAFGTEMEAWKAAARAEIDNFVTYRCFHETTKEERQICGRPLPMLCVWTQDGDLRKCRACIMGNLQPHDPTQAIWTAQAEPSSLFVALKLSRTRSWTISKHDVKGAFLTAPIPMARPS